LLHYIFAFLNWCSKCFEMKARFSLFLHFYHSFDHWTCALIFLLFSSLVEFFIIECAATFGVRFSIAYFCRNRILFCSICLDQRIKLCYYFVDPAIKGMRLFYICCNPVSSRLSSSFQDGCYCRMKRIKEDKQWYIVGL
jgi:hypothetical protein